MLQFIRPYAPDLIGWFRDFGQSTANYDANGHFARISPIVNAFQFTDNPAGGTLTALPPAERQVGLQSGKVRRCPGVGDPVRRRRLQPLRPRRLGLRSEHRPARPMMRVRLIAMTAAVAAAALVLVVFGTGAGDDHEGDYKVRAIFSSAFTVIAGEDVKISGVKVGKIADARRHARQQGRGRPGHHRARASRTSARTRPARSARSR